MRSLPEPAPERYVATAWFAIVCLAGDPRVKTVVIMNSGLFVESETKMGGMVEAKKRLEDLHTPTVYVLGGPTDIAYANGMDDFEKIDHVSVTVVNGDKGHGGTYWEPNGGRASEADRNSNPPFAGRAVGAVGRMCVECGLSQPIRTRRSASEGD